MNLLLLAGSAFLGVLAAMAVMLLGARLLGRPVARRVIEQIIKRLQTDPYHENLWEIITATWRYGAQTVLETGLRATSGKVILRPFGRMRPFPGPGFDRLLFVPAQLDRLPTPEDVQVATGVLIGPRAARPLRLDIPLLITGMGYGVALSREAKLALARGSALAGTATNTGEGLFLPEERRAAHLLVVQWGRGSWNKDPEILHQADAVEIQLGQGALAGTGDAVPVDHLGPELAVAMGAEQGKDPIVHARMPGMNDPGDLAPLLAKVRNLAGGVPIGVKLAAGGRLERDLGTAVKAGVDFITLDGAEGGTHGAAPILADDFGIPTFVALCRATRFLRGLDVDRRPSLVISGGLFTPGEFLKALALGADAVAIGTAPLYALGHTQVTKALPWEPPLDVVFYGRPAAKRLDVEPAAQALNRFLRSCVMEMSSAVRALGKESIAEVDGTDLVAIDTDTAALAGVRLYSEASLDGEPLPDRGASPYRPGPSELNRLSGQLAQRLVEARRLIDSALRRDGGPAGV